MLENTMGVGRISEIANFKSSEVPVGWVVRERTTPKGTTLLDFGCYMTNDVFLSIPMASSLKNKLIPISEGEGFKFYAVPKELQFAVIKFTNKKGKVCPMLVEPSDSNPAVFIGSLAIDCGVESIINAEIEEGSLVLGKYIDNNRKCLGIIAFNTDSGVINPSIKITVEKGVINQKQLSTVTYTFHGEGVETTTDVNDVNAPISTKFIKLKSYIVPQKDKNTTTSGTSSHAE